MTTFPEAVRSLRTEAGYTSPRAFHRRAGRAALGCTYKAYLNIEAGRSVPHPGLALRIARALGVPGDPRRARRFASAYLRSATGSEELCAFLSRVLSHGAPSEGLAEKATERSFAQRVRPLTREQAELLYGDPAAYWCFTLLSNDYGRWAPAELSRALGLGPARVLAALKSLVKAGLLSRDKGGKFFCQHTGRVFLYPREKFFLPRTLERLKKHWDSMARRQGKPLLRHAVLLRASESALSDYLPDLARAVNGVHLYTREEKSPDSAIVTVEAVVRKVLPL